MWARKQIDISWADLASALRGCVGPADAADATAAEAAVASCWPAPNAVVPTLSVRSGFDLLLTCAGWAAGDEVIMSELTITDMGRIVREHGLVPVAVPVHPESLAPSADDVAAAMTSRTRAIIVAHVFGTTLDPGPIVQMVAGREVLVIEDCAQNYQGNDFDGHPGSDIAMFSFGSIKTNTALGGAVIHVRDDGLRNQMRTRQAQWPRRTAGSFAVKVLKYIGIKFASHPTVLATIARGARWRGRDHDQWVSGLVRGFSGRDFFAAIRHRPSAAQLRLLHRRLSSFDPAQLRQRAAQAHVVREHLPAPLELISEDARDPSYWLLATSTDRPEQLAQHLRSNGFDATTQSNLRPMTAEAGTASPSRLHTMIDGAVYLPLSPNMPDSALRDMATLIASHAGDRPAKELS